MILVKTIASNIELIYMDLVHFLLEICKFLHTLSDSHKSNKYGNKDLKKLTHLQLKYTKII
jgi:cell shape-determining protein MreC